jgi:hypothetical protein
MKKTIAIFFFTVYLFSSTEAHQLMKLPIVFEHFQEHKKEDKSITMLQFLDIHYLHGSPKDKDYDRDMQLPFKSTGDCSSSLSPAYTPFFVDHVAPSPVEIASQKLQVHNNQFSISSYLASIWQPPKTL